MCWLSRAESGACTAQSEVSEVAVIWPALIAHADWGTDSRKRQVAVARVRRASGNSHAHARYAVESLRRPMGLSSSASSGRLLTLGRP